MTPAERMNLTTLIVAHADATYPMDQLRVLGNILDYVDELIQGRLERATAYGCTEEPCPWPHQT